MTLQNIEEWYKEITEREKKNEWKMEYWYWLSDIQLVEQMHSSFLLLLLKRLYQFIIMLKENEREKWVCKCNHFFLERQYILHIYLYDSGWLWKKYFDDLLSWKTQFYFKIMTETVKLVLNFCLLNTHIYSTCTGTCIYVNMI